MENQHLKTFCNLTKDTRELLHKIFASLNLSMRALDRVVKIARTVADLAESERVEQVHLAEAVQYRCLDRSLW